MKVLLDNSNEVDSANLLEKQSFRIDDGGKLIALILNKAYQDPYLAVWRELAQNASDVDPNFRVHCPTDIEPWMSIIDDGIGLSKEDVITYAAGIGSSTKDHNNDAVGGMGIGMKVPFTVTDQYTLISRWNGTEYSFSAFKDEDDSAQLVLLSERLLDTSVCNGFEIRVPVESKDFTLVHEKLPQALMFFNPKPECNVPVDWDEFDYSFSGDTWGLEMNKDSGYNKTTAKIIMGNLWYPIDSNQIQESYSDSYSSMLNNELHIHLPIGSIPLPLSREALIYNEKSIQLIRSCIDEIIEIMVQDFQELLDEQPTLYDAIKKYSELKNLMRSIGSDNSEYYYTVDNTIGRVELNTQLMIDCPADKVTTIPRYRWRYKSIIIKDYTEIKTTNNTSIYYNKLKVGLNTNEELTLIIKEGTKKVPSRCLKYMDDNYSNYDLKLWWCTDDTEQELRDWLLDIYGYTDVDLFDDVVPDYKIQRSASVSTRKLAKALILSDRLVWEEYMWWNDCPDVDLNTTRGIWVDVRSRSFDSSKYVHKSEGLYKIHQALLRWEVIPKDTRVYGAPGSHKNLMKDHPNFMHIDEAIELIFKTVDEGTSMLDKAKYNYLSICNELYSKERKLLELDIDIEMSYYNVIKKRIDQYYKLYNKDIFMSFQGCREIQSLVSNKLHYSYYESKEEELTSKFFHRYPLLNLIDTRDSNEMVKHVEEYIKLKEYCNVS